VSIWAPVVAALGASALTGALGFGGIWWQQRRRDQTASEAEKGEAYHQLIAHSLPFLMRARTLRLTMERRSGIGEGLDVVMRLRRPTDPMELYDWFAKGFEPLNEAWAKVQTIGSTDAETAATELVDACADVLEVATEMGTARGKVSTALRGVEWTAGQRDDLEAAIERVGTARKGLIEVARRELGRDPMRWPSTGSELPKANESRSALSR
jgi:hypothetical protein